ncbi:MAG: C-type lectin domain-containing protein, partial [Chloroflexi bacterium]|nr:C-type lectin domain-containing protein [Chloroflexota bacterium]
MQTETAVVPISVWNDERAAGRGDLTVSVHYKLYGPGSCPTVGPDLNGWGETTQFTAVIPTTNDCDGDGLLNECETDDCDGRPGTIDACLWDEDGDGVVDVCDLCEGYDDANDSDGDTIPNECDTCNGVDDTQDCNEDGIGDCTQLEGTFSDMRVMGNYTSCDPNYPANIMAAPRAISDVTLSLQSVADMNFDAPDEWIEFIANGVSLGKFFDGAQTCDTEDVLVVTAADWNSARDLDGARRMAIKLLRNAASCNGTASCSGGNPFQQLNIVYDYDGDSDDNGWLDECVPDCDPAGPDSDSDGTPDPCDDCPDTIPGYPYVDGVGCPYYSSPADLDLDGDVDGSDTNDFCACEAGPGTSAGPICDVVDFGGDDDVDLHDYLSLQDAVSGQDTLAEIKSIGNGIPNYILVDQFLGEPGANMGWDDASDFCLDYYGTLLATIDINLTLTEQQALIDEMTALASPLGDISCWIGLYFEMDSPPFGWYWADGNKLDLFETGGNGTSAGNWWLGYPESDAMFNGWAGTKYLLWGAENHTWINSWGEGGRSQYFNLQAWMCNAPDITLGSEDHLTPAALNVQVTSGGINSVTVTPGMTVSYDVRGQLDDINNEGLAGFALDLSFDGGDLTQADAASGSFVNFAAPLGYNNPDGFGGTVIGGDLVQVGGAQNTINYTGGDGPTGSVITDLAHSEEVMVTGTLTAPTTSGVYTLSLSNLVATTINDGETGSPVWRCEPTTAGSIGDLTITVQCVDSDSDGVCDTEDICPGFDDADDNDGDGLPDGCDTCEGIDCSCQNDSDCRLYNSYCDGCYCLALHVNEIDPVCEGTIVSCMVEPCTLITGTPVCNSGTCEICPDTDGDGICDADDNCPDDAGKVEPGICGCGVADVDTDGDGTPDCADLCPGFNDNDDGDGDGLPDGCDTCDGIDCSCQNDSDCRLHNSYCDGCYCLALHENEIDPVCEGTIVSCMVEPCTLITGTPVCNSGTCEICPDTDGDGICDA